MENFSIYCDVYEKTNFKGLEGYTTIDSSYELASTNDFDSAIEYLKVQNGTKLVSELFGNVNPKMTYVAVILDNTEASVKFTTILDTRGNE